MNFWKKCLPSILITFGANQGVASIDDDLDRLISTLPPGHIHSIKVIEAETGKVLFDRNSSFNLLPASTVKAITAISAYRVLGDEYRYQTSLLSNKPLSEGKVYAGDLVLRFSGDPSLTRADLSALLGKLNDKGVKVIRGTIWLDGSVYDGYPRAGGASWDDHNICFAAPVSAMILDRNCFFGWLVPSGKEGQLSKMVYDEPQWQLSIDNRVAIRKSPPHESNGCVQEVWPSSKHEYRLEGCIASDAKPMRMAFSVRDPERAAARFVESFLQANNIKLEGRIVIEKPQGDFKWLVASHHSVPVPDLLQRVLDKSDNLYADSLLKTIGSSVKGEKGSYSSGTEAVLAMLKEEGVDLTRGRLVDGSGLSRYNMLSADNFTEVLQTGWRSWRESAPWLASREDERRWLKTGHMSGVNSMVGYAFPENSAPLIFAVLLNGLRPVQPATNEEKRAFHQEIRLFHRAFLERLTDTR
ncbi:D-alanyl-D-alanine carboxypeptidase/D-alanyl-D-alanine-endopeptidase [Endozoicomonas sp. SCSIO W0465]|uniref:D-alanyl-D-alanine carboxypeptidase/D-alanyl-D-alanine endopeptidase n=1 Tax=Endozoicomonas sp. SCSIO W0465 TaxID=2918516 RepID=UPI002074C3A4|nr:D-alanyl-D-alanine carboxypeptidase/D-alanyl-D-alanine-endopeptidase [Endozoicomonas sp. SCSIO W0465]USE37984.1 D-alanyl-D-alanine carboxypeptidase/D-alanyl-D-alanine-endopeptidase [Endozoicomonas sp. SCSIO W0465]